MKKTKEEKINELLLKLSKLGEESYDEKYRTGKLNWRAIGMAVSHVTSNSQDIVEVAYSALEDWNFHSLCALLDYLFPDMHPHLLHPDSQEWFDSMLNIAKLLNRRGELLLLDSKGEVHNYRLDVVLNKLEGENNTFKYVHIAGKRTYSTDCADCQSETPHTDQKHFENVGGVSVIEESDIDSESVTLLASGYEWHCPQCKRLNSTVESAKKVTCSNCGETFTANPPEHV